MVTPRPAGEDVAGVVQPTLENTSPRLRLRCLGPCQPDVHDVLGGIEQVRVLAKTSRDQVAVNELGAVIDRFCVGFIAASPNLARLLKRAGKPPHIGSERGGHDDLDPLHAAFADELLPVPPAALSNRSIGHGVRIPAYGIVCRNTGQEAR